MKSKNHGFSLIELLTVMSIIVLIIGILLPTLSYAKKKSNAIYCLNNLRQIGFGMRAYAYDNNGFLPEIIDSNDEVLPSFLNSYLSNFMIYKCKSDPKTNNVSYYFNTTIGGKNIDYIRLNSTVSLVYDKEAWHGFKNAVFVDGHTAKLPND